MKKWQSNQDKEIFFTPWECPLMGVEYLAYVGHLAVCDTRFFICSHESTYVITIPRLSPFRLVDEGCLGNFVSLLWRGSEAPSPLKFKTWKAWNTPFVKELGDNLFLNEPEEERFQYIIFTSDECPEFISSEPEIAIYEGDDYLGIMKTLFEEDAAKMKTTGPLNSD